MSKQKTARVGEPKKGSTTQSLSQSSCVKKIFSKGKKLISEREEKDFEGFSFLFLY